VLELLLLKEKEKDRLDKKGGFVKNNVRLINSYFNKPSLAHRKAPLKKNAS